MPAKLTQTQVIQQFIAKHGGKYDYSLVEYIDSHTPVIIICPVHGRFTQKPMKHKAGSGCRLCSNKRNALRNTLNQKQVIEDFKSVHGNKYDYSKVEYRGTNKPIIIICPIHGEFLQKPVEHKSGGGCKKCGHETIRKQKTIPWKTVLNEFNIVHGNKYDYSESNFINMDSEITIICPEHGAFSQKPKNHRKGYGCKKCSKVHQYTTEEIIIEFQKVHGNKYDYSLVEYNGANNKVSIICKKHGVFKQRVAGHKEGKGCPFCALDYTADINRYSQEDAIKKFKETHSNLYDYSKVVYVDSKKKVEIICKLHGSFFQIPYDHWSGHGCPKCAQEINPVTYSISTAEENREEWSHIPAIFYHVLITSHDGTERFMKYGVTKHDVKERFKNDHKLYRVEILEQTKVSLYEAIYMEADALSSVQHRLYYPKHLHGGGTECYK